MDGRCFSTSYLYPLVMSNCTSLIVFHHYPAFARPGMSPYIPLPSAGGVEDGFLMGDWWLCDYTSDLDEAFETQDFIWEHLSVAGDATNLGPHGRDLSSEWVDVGHPDAGEFTTQLHPTYLWCGKICRVGLYTELFYAIIPTLFLCFLLICCPYILLHFNHTFIELPYIYPYRKVCNYFLIALLWDQ